MPVYTAPVLHLVHGFNVRDGGAGTVGRFCLPGSEKGWQILKHDYGHVGLYAVRDKGLKIARDLVRYVSGGDVGLGHSNGCAVLLEAAWQGAPFKELIFINPALDADTPLPPHVEKCHVWHVPGDLAVTMSKLLPYHVWGEMGATGYTGADPRYINHNAAKEFPAIPFPFWNRHSRLFDFAGLTAPRILNDLQAPEPVTEES